MPALGWPAHPSWLQENVGIGRYGAELQLQYGAGGFLVGRVQPGGVCMGQCPGTGELGMREDGVVHTLQWEEPLHSTLVLPRSPCPSQRGSCLCPLRAGRLPGGQPEFWRGRIHFPPPWDLTIASLVCWGMLSLHILSLSFPAACFVMYFVIDM